jgi:DNA-directed RNA polymerase subunit beta
MGDEDDDLLRAAEELGIDLSGVRAGEPMANEEGADATDAKADTEQPEEAEADAEDAAEDVDGEVDAGDLGMTDDALATDAEYLAPADSSDSE